MAQLKSLSEKYIKEIDAFWQRDWSDTTLPDQRTSIIDAVAVDDNDRAIGYGQVKLFAEMMLFLDLQASKRDRVDSLKKLMTEGFRGVERSGLSDVYCYIKDMRFARTIAKRYDFHLVDSPGMLLVKDMRGK